MHAKRIIAGALAVLSSVCPGASRGQQAPAFRYPEAPKSATVEEYHGVKVADPYRPLEDPDAAATRAWVEAENKITFSFLEGIPQRAAIRARLTALWDYEKVSPPQIEGGRYFFSSNTGLQNQSVLYTADSLDADAQVRARPQHALERRHGGPGRNRGEPGRQAAGLRHRRGRLGLERVEGARGGHRQRPGRPPEVDQVLRGTVDARRQGLLLRPLSGTEARRRPEGGQLPPEGLPTTGWEQPRGKTPSSGKIPSTRTGRLTRPSATTANT